MTIGSRIKQIRKYLNLTQQKFADELGLKQNTVATYEMNKTVPSDRTVMDICLKFNINKQWLLTGEGEMKKKVSEDEELASLFSQLLRDDDDEKTTKIKKRVIANLLRLDVEDWKKITAFAQSILDNDETE